MITLPHAPALSAIVNAPAMIRPETPPKPGEPVQQSQCDDDALGWGCRYCGEQIGRPHEPDCLALEDR